MLHFCKKKKQNRVIAVVQRVVEGADGQGVV